MPKRTDESVLTVTELIHTFRDIEIEHIRNFINLSGCEPFWALNCTALVQYTGSDAILNSSGTSLGFHIELKLLKNSGVLRPPGSPEDVTSFWSVLKPALLHVKLHEFLSHDEIVR